MPGLGIVVSFNAARLGLLYQAWLGHVRLFGPVVHY